MALFTLGAEDCFATATRTDSRQVACRCSQVTSSSSDALGVWAHRSEGLLGQRRRNAGPCIAARRESSADGGTGRAAYTQGTSTTFVWLGADARPTRLGRAD